MTSILNVPTANQLLVELPEVERNAFMAACNTVELSFGKVLLQPTETFTHVYFPIDSFISLIVVIDTDKRLEVAMAGREGMLGSSLVLGIDEAPLLALVQGAGSALRIDAGAFQQLLLSTPVLQQRLKRYIYVVMKQLATSAACNHFHRIEERLARWLLITQDRAGTDQLNLTHEFLAMMLGVRRAGITLAAIALQARGLIRYQRGTITVLDRLGLIEASCDCYSDDCALYAKMLPVI
ncbi:Crp/Fnr family transcriptional regulator [Halomonas sp. IOP_14]|jgi:CRP-like cAMP-binding protein|uniref:Winged helix-turn-helix transcription repressor, DNA-binding n=1 Tax=Vreelandella titanicae BH1 TaxID=1204738 RepID=L9U6K5_9GAMM|nr:MULTISPECIES: Crp/Fnr family transcriptional regulator [Halomonas]ELY20437.1 Winged helix-turn-helix transcription repressor, DNA-binding [Halomonas titanicae BH1]MCD1585036.1 Crp/Fnr family transcriptional regulator [Halomonas sp. IOP_14]NVE92745.1 Crp/Fnr family transcriptional regulator [Halomonas titanicae]|tara:strand:- start:28 stop:741 length:714 start_codon:yes stop_codon:yes gene_type:complete